MKLIKQKTDNDCVLCCVAMVAGVSYKEALKAFDGEPPYNFWHEIAALNRLGMMTDYTNPRFMYENSIYLITVPSLNISHVNHRIVVDLIVPGYKVYDPQKGIKGKEFYEYKDIKGFSEVVRVFDVRKPLQEYPL